LDSPHPLTPSLTGRRGKEPFFKSLSQPSAAMGEGFRVRASYPILRLRYHDEEYGQPAGVVYDTGIISYRSRP
jgi:hypothetical protein